MSMAIVRFKVGEDEENEHRPPEPEDVRQLRPDPAGRHAATGQAALDRRRADPRAHALEQRATTSFALRRIAAPARRRRSSSSRCLRGAGSSAASGGRYASSSIPARMASHGVAPARSCRALRQANRQLRAGQLVGGKPGVSWSRRAVSSATPRTWARSWSASPDGRPVYLRDVATIVDGPEEAADYVFVRARRGGRTGITAGRSARGDPLRREAQGDERDRRRRQVSSRKIEPLRGTARFPARRRSSTVTRNYGETAAEKSNELLLHMVIAVVSVSDPHLARARPARSGDRRAGHPGDARAHARRLLPLRLHAEPDHAVRADLLDRHPGRRRDRRGREHRPPLPAAGEPRRARWPTIAVEAVDEVGNPTILATFTVIAAILPMAFVRGLMGPYMRPIPVGASAAMIFSLLVAFVVTPWAAVRLLQRAQGRATTGRGEGLDHTRSTAGLMGALLRVPRLGATAFLAMVVVLLLGRRAVARRTSSSCA